MTAEELNALLAGPLALFVVMLLASFANGLKQLTEAKKNGTAMTLGSYLGHWPETASTVILNVLAFVLLLGTDQLGTEAPLGLKLAAVMGIGFGVNSLSDLLTKGGRSAALGGK